MSSIRGFSYGRRRGSTEISQVGLANYPNESDDSLQGIPSKKSNQESGLLLRQKKKALLKQNKEKCTKRALETLSSSLSFDENVIKQRSSQNVPFEAYFDIRKRLETDIDQRKPVNQTMHSSYYRNRHMPCHLEPIKDESIIEPSEDAKNVKSSESLWLGVINSSEHLAKISHNPTEQQNTNIKLSPKENTSTKLTSNEHTKKPLKSVQSAAGWEEHVLSLISEGTADTIVKEFSNHNQTQLNKYLDKKKQDNKPSLNIESNESLSDVFSTKTIENQESMQKEVHKHIMYDHIDLSELTSKNVKKMPKKFESRIQQTYPLTPETWSKNIEIKASMQNKNQKGIRKWTDYPQEIKEEVLKLSKLSIKNLVVDKPPSQNIELKIATRQRNNNNLLIAVDEWRTKWLLEKKWQSKTILQLRDGMKNINDHVRLAAVSASGKVILDRKERFRRKEDMMPEESNWPEVESEIINEIKLLLEDKSNVVGLAASIALYSVNQVDTKATRLLLNTVQNGAPSERWIACQCLAEYNIHDDCIIVEMLNIVQNGADPVKTKRIEAFLRKLSNLTDTIQYMLSERLNSTSWNDRIMACQLFPVLSGPLKKDVANKLSYIAWHDWNKEVRMAAATTLGRTGNGKLIHDALCKYLKSPKTSQQIEALRKISNLGIVTAQLMVPFLLCLKSQHGTVALEAMRVIRLNWLCTDEIVNTLSMLITSDRNLKVKLNAIKTLGVIGEKNNLMIREILLWCIRFEKDRMLRQASCQAIGKIKYSDKEVINTMQDMLVVEDNKHFRSLISNTLNSLGYEDTCDESMISAVQERVKELCQKDNVLLKILAGSQSNLLQKYRNSKQIDEAENESSEDNDEGDDTFDEDRFSINQPFYPTLEAYRARQITHPSISLPDIQPSYIPFWSESISSLREEGAQGGVYSLK
eukprot:TCONS_00071306-protein